MLEIEFFTEVDIVIGEEIWLEFETFNGIH